MEFKFLIKDSETFIVSCVPITATVGIQSNFYQADVEFCDLIICHAYQILLQIENFCLCINIKIVYNFIIFLRNYRVLIIYMYMYSDIGKYYSLHKMLIFYDIKFYLLIPERDCSICKNY